MHFPVEMLDHVGSGVMACGICLQQLRLAFLVPGNPAFQQGRVELGGNFR